MDNDSLVATRARRPNAGSRLKLLIELEEQSSGVQSMIYTEDDENVQLLFQEDENDEEFEEPDESGDEQEDENNENSQDELPDDENIQQSETNGSETEVAVNSDEMLSDSDLSVSEDDESEGERELQSQERSKKRKHRLKTIIPAIKKHKTVSKPSVPKPKVNHSELLLLSERRSSSRKSALQNKQVLLEKLKEDETRRAALTPVVRVKERELTQEERLAEAKETEKQNVISLNLFLQQEIVKKERQKLLFQQRRAKLRNVVRLFSAESFVTPLDEIEDARHVQDMFERKRRGRRRKNQLEEPDVKRPGDIDTELPYYQREMAEKRRIEAEQAEERRKLEEARAVKRKKLEEERAERKRLLEEERLARKKAKEERLKEYENMTEEQKAAINLGLKASGSHKVDLMDVDPEAGSDEDNIDANEDAVRNDGSSEHKGNESSEKDPVDESLVKEDIGEVEQTKDGEVAVEKVIDVDEIAQKDATDDDLKSKDSKELTNDATADKTPQRSGVIEKLEIVDDFEDTPVPSLEQVNESANNDNTKESGTDKPDSESEKATSKDTEMEDGKEVTIKQEITEDIKKEEKVQDEEVPFEKVEKKVTFAGLEEHETKKEEEEVAEEPQEPEVEEEKLSRSSTPIYRSLADGTVFEGPVQHVARNLVFLLNFDEEDRWGLTDMRIKTAIFGDDLGGSRRFQDLRTILKSSLRLDNPYAAPKEEKGDELFNPVTKITEESSLFDSLLKLPRFGDKEIFEEEEEEESNATTSEIQIKTEAPTGLYLPNGNKKICLISGKEVRYYDPATGLPYGSKEVYLVIKAVELGVMPWYSIPKDQNTYGAVEIYLNRREGARHAKGVPEGFDGY